MAIEQLVIQNLLYIRYWGARDSPANLIDLDKYFVFYKD